MKRIHHTVAIITMQQILFLTTIKYGALIYGEIFINIESFTSRTAEIKNILLDGYKKLFADPDLLQTRKIKTLLKLRF